MVYPFVDSDVPMILNELLSKKVIILLELNRPEVINKVNNPKYYKFHHIIGHPIKKCFIFKDRIMALLSEGKVIIDMDENMDSNHSCVLADENYCLMSQTIISNFLL